jgi:DNA-binding MarR family transcriptional regulator
MIALSFLGGLRPAFLAHVADRLNMDICDQTAGLFERREITAPVRSASTLLFLLKEGPATLSEMARTDGQSHQALSARLAPLEALSLIERTTDPNDNRRRPYALTRSGVAEARRIEAACTEIANAIDDMFEEIGIDVLANLDAAREALRRRPLEGRLTETPRRKRRS